MSSKWNKGRRPHRARRKDRNHNAIMQALVHAFFDVDDVSDVPGLGCDLIVGKHGYTLLVEVKHPDSVGRLTASEQTKADHYRGAWLVATCAEDVLKWFDERIE